MTWIYEKLTPADSRRCSNISIGAYALWTIGQYWGGLLPFLPIVLAIVYDRNSRKCFTYLTASVISLYIYSIQWIIGFGLFYYLTHQKDCSLPYSWVFQIVGYSQVGFACAKIVMASFAATDIFHFRYNYKHRLAEFKYKRGFARCLDAVQKGYEVRQMIDNLYTPQLYEVVTRHSHHPHLDSVEQMAISRYFSCPPTSTDPPCPICSNPFGEDRGIRLRCCYRLMHADCVQRMFVASRQCAQCLAVVNFDWVKLHYNYRVPT